MTELVLLLVLVGMISFLVWGIRGAGSELEKELWEDE